MGIVFVLFFWAVAWTIIAAIASAVLGTATFLLTKKASQGRKRARFLAIIFPFACILYAGAWFITYAVINEVAFHRDPGLGDSWETPLPNGYAIEMIDVTDEGAIYNPKTQGGYGSASSRDDAVFGVRQAQLAGEFIFGARDSGYFGRIGQESNVVDAYFELDTTKDSHTEFKSIDELRHEAASKGITLHLEPINSLYIRYRYTWFDYAALAVLLIAPAIGFLLLAHFVWRVRSATNKEPATAF